MRCLSSTSSSAPRGVRWVQVGVLALSVCGSVQASDSDWRAVGNDQYFNHEYKEAVDSFRRLVELEPEDPGGFVLLAKAQLYKETARLRLLDTSAFRDDPEFYEGDKPKPDPVANKALLDTLQTGKLLCERLLQADTTDRRALHALARIHALRGAFEIMIGKDYFRALANGRRAKALSYRLAELYPEFVDGTLVAGLDEYMLGSLPWALQALIALSGYRGKKKTRLAENGREAGEGESSRSDARVLLTLAYRRERRYLDAAREFHALAQAFPRAFTYPLEAAAMYKAVGEHEKALEIFREVYRKRAAGEDHFDRMPARWAEALQRGIQKLDQRIKAKTARVPPSGSQAASNRWEKATRDASFAAAAPESIDLAASAAPSAQLPAVPATRSAAPALMMTMSLAGPFSPDRTARRIAEFFSGPPPASASALAGGKSKSAGPRVPWRSPPACT